MDSTFIISDINRKKLQLAGERLVAVTILLVTVGLVMVYAASALKGEQQFGDAFIFIRKQILMASFGFFVMLCIKTVPMKFIEKMALPMVLLAWFLLALIFVPGVYKNVGGASRWIAFGGIRFQTSEFAKLALVFFLAKNLGRKGFDISSFRTGIGPNVAVFLCFAFFLMRQKDFGSTVLLGAVLFFMLFAAGLKRKYIVTMATTSLIGMGAAVLVAPYRVARLTSFLNPWGEIQHGGFQIIQSYLAFQNGGALGLGLGESRQKLFFLPEAHTDFILAVLAEELGFMGVALICMSFAYYCFLGFRIALLQTRPFQMYLAFGLTSMVGLQSAINMGVAMGLLPTKGIPLPFMSSGASSLLMSLVITSILWRLSVHDQSTSDQSNAKAF